MYELPSFLVSIYYSTMCFSRAAKGNLEELVGGDGEINLHN